PAKTVPGATVASKKAPVVAAPPKKAPVKKAPPKPVFVKPPVPGKKAPSKDGIIANRDFDLTFLRAQRVLLQQQRAHLLGQAERLDIERERLIEEAGMGDEQFDEDGGEGDTMAVERERDRVLSDQARQTVEEIDAALARITSGDYGYSVVSTKPIPRERLEVIPWATELVEERVGWIGRR
ncbi:MAG: TraR/DksA family transcriptional regulator, partial [Actinomycetota bacterium]